MARTGPNTPESKAVVRLNAVQHGIFAAAPVIPGVEDPAEWRAFRAALVSALGTVGGVE
ncbi:MAG: hypothetical protein M3P30_07360 [Chloroflexota bacterium]|nr:hypothetical protein [Chloroflexota bacterium]